MLETFPFICAHLRFEHVCGPLGPADGGQWQRDVPQSQSSIVHARDRQDAPLVSKQAPQHISRDQPNRMIGGAAGRGGRPGESRLDLLRENARLSETSERDSVVVAPLQRMISDSALATPKSCGGQRRI